MEDLISLDLNTDAIYSNHSEFRTSFFSGKDYFHEMTRSERPLPQKFFGRYSHLKNVQEACCGIRTHFAILMTLLIGGSVKSLAVGVLLALVVAGCNPLSIFFSGPSWVRTYKDSPLIFSVPRDSSDAVWKRARAWFGTYGTP